MTSRQSGRPPFYRLTAAAGIVLVVDAVLLGVLGLRSGRPVLIGISLAAMLLAVLLLRLWRAHARRWAAVRDARQAVQDEVRALASLVREAERQEPGR